MEHTSKKSSPKYGEFRGSEALYSRVLQGFVDWLDEFPERKKHIHSFFFRIKDRVAQILG